MKDLKVESGKIIYRGSDKNIRSAVDRINSMGGFPIMSPGDKKKNGFTDTNKIIEPTNDNLWRLEDYL